MSACPRCAKSLLTTSYEGVSVEACPQCEGQWLSPEQLKEIVDAREKTWKQEELDAMKRASVRGVQVEAVQENLSCPTCEFPMEAFQYGGDSGILLDKCRRCGGIWLDRGELDKVQMLVEAADQAVTTDLKWFSGRLRELELREERREQRANRISRAPLITAITNQILDVE